MKTFNAVTKKKYINRAIGHRKADEIVQGIYWEDGKGCAIGCLSHSNENAHEELEKQTGIPEWLSRVADTIFEGLSEEDCKAWPERFVAAVPKNKNHEYMELNVKAPFLVYILESVLKNFDHTKYPDVKAAVEGSIALWSRSAAGNAAGNAAWSAARSAAGNAAGNAAWSAARSAAGNAAGNAAWSAAGNAAGNAAWSAAGNAARSAAGNAARSAARSAAWSAAGSAARSAAGNAAYKDYSDKLINIMEAS